MKRRQFLTTATGGMATSVLAAPAIAQSMPEVRWRLQSAFPKSLDTLWGGAELFCRLVSDLTEGRFQIQPFAAGEIVGTFQVADAVGDGTVEAGYATTYYYVGKDPTFALPCDMPFGPNARQKNAWMYHGGGLDLCNEFFAKHKMYAVPAGNTGAQMGGWYRKEIKTVQDLQGLKMRIGGLGGQVLQRLGAVSQPISAGDIYPALERRTVNAAAAQTYVDVLGKYDARNPAAVRRLVGSGAQLRPFSQELMDAAFKGSNELYDEISAKNPDFKKLYESSRAFRNEEYLWFQVAE